MVVVVFVFCGMRTLVPAYNGNNTLLGDGIVPGLAEWITSEYSPNGQDKPDKKATFLKCFYSIGRAGWCEPAAGRF